MMMDSLMDILKALFVCLCVACFLFMYLCVFRSIDGFTDFFYLASYVYCLFLLFDVIINRYKLVPLIGLTCSISYCQILCKHVLETNKCNTFAWHFQSTVLLYAYVLNMFKLPHTQTHAVVYHALMLIKW